MPKSLKNRKLTESQKADIHNYDSKQLTPLAIRFIDEYLANGMRVGIAYNIASNKKDIKPSKATINAGSRLLRYKCVREEINARLEETKITGSKINMRLWNIANKRSEKTLNVAVQALTTLARIKGMIKEGERGDGSFFQSNYLVYSPIVSQEDVKKVKKLVDNSDRLIE